MEKLVSHHQSLILTDLPIHPQHSDDNNSRHDSEAAPRAESGVKA